MSSYEHKPPRRRTAAVAVVSLTAAVALGGVLGGGTVAAAPSSNGGAHEATAKKKKKTKLVLKSSRFGPVLFDGRSQVLYAFERDEPNRSRCFGGCARAWPPFYKRGKLKIGGGVDRSLVGTIKRGSRRQITYKGQPLYFYAHEGPNQILCHNVNLNGGLWWVIQASGSPAP